MKLILLAIIMSGCAITGNTAALEEHFNYSVYFCGKDNCIMEISKLVNESEKAVCALYSFDETIFEKADVVNHTKLPGIMHNKFCIFDNAVWTGSYNPTGRKTIDNAVLINSTILAGIYERKFDAIKSGEKFGGGKAMLNNTAVEVYFCPDSDCIQILNEKLLGEKESIYFAAYTFTHTRIANTLILKNLSGIIVDGVIEVSGKNSKLEMLEYRGLAQKDRNRLLMHNKFWVIDEMIVITGSMNPTINGGESNDENMIVIYDGLAAYQYNEEFRRIRDNI